MVEVCTSTVFFLFSLRPTRGDLKMADSIAARLALQEEQIHLLTQEIGWLQAASEEAAEFFRACISKPELDTLRNENEKLRYRIVHLKRSLRAELDRSNAVTVTACSDTHDSSQQEHGSGDGAKPQEQELFFFHDLSPGSCFFLPKGAFIYNTLVEFIKEEHMKSDFQEVITPNIYNNKLWEASGHRQHYSGQMFTFEVEKEIFALKPMNCPGHCLMFSHRPRSWRELPLRFADFGVLHRNEVSGDLTGLERVRRFQQDDAHIFCSVEQITQEINSCLEFLHTVYSIFGFSFQLCLSTRPEKFLGDIETWNFAEKQLEASLNEFGKPWKTSPGDGTFYGPKIDIKVQDANGKYHQCATIQLDFQLPLQFNLTYVGKDGNDTARPVIIHRAILGSIERMIAVLKENYGGKWPLWLSPQQVMIVPECATCKDYAWQVCQKFAEAGFMVDVDLDKNKEPNEKITNAQLAQYNFIMVVGEKEKAAESVTVRTRENKFHGEMTVHQAINKLQKLKTSRSSETEREF
ncbi:SYTC2 ligase, partial [Polypterus senegalus]